MTAKRIREKLIQEIQARHPDSATVLLQQYEVRLCREQRENLLKACNFDSDYQYYFATADEILNAPTPDL